MADIVLALVTPLIEAAVTTTISFAGTKFSLDWDLEKELRELALSVTMIQEVLKDAEEKQESNRAVRHWLQHLADVAYDAVDVLDEYAYEVLKHKAKTQGQKRKHVSSLSFLSKTHGQQREQVRSFTCLSKSTSFPSNMGHLAEKVKKINESLDKLQKNAEWLKLIKSSGETSPIGRPYVKTDSVIDCSKVVGRQNDVSDIVKMLGEMRSQHHLSGITIVGMGGIGKTTLAKLVCECVKEQKLYDLVAWVCVSENFDEQMIFGELLEYLDESANRTNNLDALLQKLVEKLENEKIKKIKKIEKILLVLDDVWEEDTNKVENFSFHLSKILKTSGSSIIATTRSDKVASIMEERLAMRRHDTMKLKDDQCWSIIKAIVLRSSTETSLPLDLERIGQEIAKKCEGLPLVASIIGGALSREMEEDKWKKILDDKAWEVLQKENKKILSILKISFDRLPSPLKKCFSYCSIFPKDFVIKKDDLIQLWMAQGFVHKSNESFMEVEDVGNEYFNELLFSSLFQDTKLDLYGNIESCKMHDLVHDLALLVSRDETLFLDTSCSNTDQIPGTIRHLRVKTDGGDLPTIPRSIARRLHSLFSEVAVFSSLASDLKSLRALKLTRDEGKKLPTSLGKLKHLRYLDISGTYVKTVPKSFSKLYNLQTAKFVQCRYLIKLPNGMANLINLRYIYSSLPITRDISIMQLTSLQTLSHFVVSTKEGCQIEDLGCLSHLGGKLKISKLEHVRSELEASKGNLKEKTKLHQLVLSWSRRDGREVNNNNDNDEMVLKGLQPHSTLKSLTIDGYIGKTFPSWMGSGTNSSGSSLILNNMVELKLINCHECTCVPSLGLLPSLKVLYIQGMKKVKRMGHELRPGGAESMRLFPALKTLTVSDMERLEEWVEVVEDAAAGSQGVVVFPCLEELLISDCPLLKTWSMGGFSSHHGLSALKKLELVGCGELTSLPIGLGSCISLQLLLIRSCRNLNPIPSINGLTSLENLNLWDCNGLTCLPIGLDSCYSLQQLAIYSCPNLISIFDNISKLCSFSILRISHCENLRSIQSGLGYCISLQQLAIESCPNLISIAEDIGKLHSLSILKITYCENLRSIPGEWLDSLTRLKKLSLGPFWSESEEFPGLTSINQFHTSLEQLHLTGWDKLKSLPHQLRHLTALKELKLVNFNGLESLPEWFGDLSSLHRLEIEHCSNLIHLPSIKAMRHLCRSNLQFLRIWHCPKLKKRCAKKRGLEWPKICGIPNIRIHGKDVQGEFKYKDDWWL